jgi:hypothetical protein
MPSRKQFSSSVVPPESGEQKPKKPYTQPKLTRIHPDQANAILRERGLPGDPNIAQLLAATSQNGPTGQTSGKGPVFSVKIELLPAGSGTVAELRMALEGVGRGHLETLRRYLDLCETFMLESSSGRD